MTREQAEAAGWVITDSPREPRWIGDKTSAISRCIEMIEGYEQHRTSRGLSGLWGTVLRDGV